MKAFTISELLIFFTGIEHYVKRHIDCCGMEIGIGLAVFGQQTRLIQDATTDNYELVMELIGNINYIFKIY